MDSVSQGIEVRWRKHPWYHLYCPSQVGMLRSILADLEHCQFSLHVPDLSSSLRIVSWAPASRMQWVIAQWQSGWDIYILLQHSSMLRDDSENSNIGADSWIHSGRPSGISRELCPIRSCYDKKTSLPMLTSQSENICCSRLEWDMHDVTKKYSELWGFNNAVKSSRKDFLTLLRAFFGTPLLFAFNYSQCRCDFANSSYNSWSQYIINY